ncbi:MAG: tetratricopeptide repeat protein [Acidobacteria bacterium]|nr:tetratricopeptide repeat protein [Acidobacteriota bacterium]
MPNETAVTDVTLDQILDGEATMNDIFGFSDLQIQSIAVLGFQAYEQGRNDEARILFEGLTALDSKSYYGYAGLGVLALVEDDVDAAVDYLRQAAERTSGDAAVYANLGEALFRQGKVEEAADAFQKAIELDPEGKDPGANRARAMMYGVSVVLEEAAKAMEQE